MELINRGSPSKNWPKFLGLRKGTEVTLHPYGKDQLVIEKMPESKR